MQGLWRYPLACFVWHALPAASAQVFGPLTDTRRAPVARAFSCGPVNPRDQVWHLLSSPVEHTSPSPSPAHLGALFLHAGSALFRYAAALRGAVRGTMGWTANQELVSNVNVQNPLALCRRARVRHTRETPVFSRSQDWSSENEPWPEGKTALTISLQGSDVCLLVARSDWEVTSSRGTWAERQRRSCHRC